MNGEQLTEHETPIKNLTTHHPLSRTISRPQPSVPPRLRKTNPSASKMQMSGFVRTIQDILRNAAGTSERTIKSIDL